MAECAAKNMIDKDEYPQTAELEQRCVNMIAHLWHAPETGSHRLLHHRLERGLHAGRTGPEVALAPASPGRGQARWTGPTSSSAPTSRCAGRSSAATSTSNPAWSRSARRSPILTAETAMAPATRTPSASSRCSAPPTTGPTSRSPRSPPPSTSSPAPDGGRRAHPRRRGIGWLRRPLPRSRAGVGLPCSRVSSRSTPRATSTGSSIPAWVGSSGATVAPAQGPRLQGRLPGRAACPPSPSTSRGRARRSSAQYYNFLRLGRRRLTARCRRRAGTPRTGSPDEIDGLAPYELVSKGDGIPAFAFRITDAPYSVYDVSDALRIRGWIVPAYTMPPALDHTSPCCASWCATASAVTWPAC